MGVHVSEVVRACRHFPHADIFESANARVHALVERPPSLRQPSPVKRDIARVSRRQREQHELAIRRATGDPF
jgi:REP element-mobilizing transposase RayT